jgi:hypothetical protein
MRVRRADPAAGACGPGGSLSGPRFDPPGQTLASMEDHAGEELHPLLAPSVTTGAHGTAANHGFYHRRPGRGLSMGGRAASTPPARWPPQVPRLEQVSRAGN